MRFDLSLIVIAGVLLSGCPANDLSKGLQPAVPDSTLDYNDFVCEAQPVLIKRCSYLGCHGNPVHALRIYSVGKLRAGDVETREQRDAPLTAAEVQLNFDSAVGLTLSATGAERAQPDVAKIPLLLKPLAARLGGSEHHGVAVFPTSPHRDLSDDPEWNALANWVSGAKQPVPPVPSCLDLFTNLGITPK